MSDDPNDTPQATYPIEQPTANEMVSTQHDAAPADAAPAPQPNTEPGFLQSCLDAICCCWRPKNE